MNVAVGCARLGLATNLITHYADDKDCRLIGSHLQWNDVSVLRGGTAATSRARQRSAPTGAPPTLSISLGSQPRFHTAIRPPLTLLQAAKEAYIGYDPNCGPAIYTDVDSAHRRAEMFGPQWHREDQRRGWL